MKHFTLSALCRYFPTHFRLSVMMKIIFRWTKRCEEVEKLMTEWRQGSRKYEIQLLSNALSSFSRIDDTLISLRPRDRHCYFVLANSNDIIECLDDARAIWLSRNQYIISILQHINRTFMINEMRRCIQSPQAESCFQYLTYFNSISVQYIHFGLDNSLSLFLCRVINDDC